MGTPPNPIQDQPFQTETVDSLAGKIKAKYSDYAAMDNAELVHRTIQKYPEYQTHLSSAELQRLSGGKPFLSTMEDSAARSLGYDPEKIQNQPTLGSQWKEAGRETLGNLKSLGKSFLHDPSGATGVESLATQVEGGGRKVYQGARSGDRQQLAEGTGELLAGTATALAPHAPGGAGEVAQDVRNAAGAVADTAREIPPRLGSTLRGPGKINPETGVATRGPLKPGTALVSRVAGAAAGGAAGGAGLGPYGAMGGIAAGWKAGPQIADAILPANPEPTGYLPPGHFPQLPKSLRLPAPEEVAPAPTLGRTLGSGTLTNSPSLPTSDSLPSLGGPSLGRETGAPVAATMPPDLPPVNMRFVDKFDTPKLTPRLIADPDSPPLGVKTTYQSYPRETLVKMAGKGDVNAIRELQRNPAGYELPPNAKYLIEGNARPVPFRNYSESGAPETSNLVTRADTAYPKPREVVRFGEPTPAEQLYAQPEQTAPRTAAEKLYAQPEQAPRVKGVPVAQRFDPDVIAQAESEMRGALDLGGILPRAGRYFAENSFDEHPLAGRYDIKAGERPGGTWYGIGAQKGNIGGQFPWFNDPEISLSAVQKAISAGKGADYERIVGKIGERITNERSAASSAISEDVPRLRELAEQVREIEPDLAQALNDLADGKTGLAPDALKTYVKERISDATEAAQLSREIDEAAAEARQAGPAETDEASPPTRGTSGEAGPSTQAPQLSTKPLGKKGNGIG